jgi:hypothetical protein
MDHHTVFHGDLYMVLQVDLQAVKWDLECLHMAIAVNVKVSVHHTAN